MSTNGIIGRYENYRVAKAFILLLLVAFGGEARTGEVGEDPDVLAAERLFSAWMESQIAYRGIPGVVVGVVSGDDISVP